MQNFHMLFWCSQAGKINGEMQCSSWIDSKINQLQSQSDESLAPEYVSLLINYRLLPLQVSLINQDTSWFWNSLQLILWHSRFCLGMPATTTEFIKIYQYYNPLKQEQTIRHEQTIRRMPEGDLNMLNFLFKYQRNKQGMIMSIKVNLTCNKYLKCWDSWWHFDMNEVHGSTSSQWKHSRWGRMKDNYQQRVSVILIVISSFRNCL